LFAALAGGVQAAERVDLIIRNGVIYDGSGGRSGARRRAVKAGRVGRQPASCRTTAPIKK
jgi:N-acyl-D-aspartate/D-glutamate deacylase